MSNYIQSESPPSTARGGSIANTMMQDGAFLDHVIKKLDRALDHVVVVNGTLNSVESRIFGPSLASGSAGSTESKSPPSQEGQIISRLEALIGAVINADETASRLASRL